MLVAISPDFPCGEDLTWDPLLSELRASMKGRVDRKIEETSGGKRMVEVVEEPSWRKVLQLSETALARSRHLEVCVIYATARLQLDGLEGLAEGVELVTGLVQRYWGEFFPLLDAEDGNDPSRRFGLLENLSHAPATLDDDPLRFVDRLRQTPLCHVPGAATVNLLLLQDSKPKSDSSAAQLVRSALAEAFRLSPGDIDRKSTLVNRTLAALDGMMGFLTTTLGIKEPPAVDRLIGQLRVIQELYEGCRHGGETAPAPSDEALAQNTKENLTVAASPSSGTSAEIRTSADVLRMLDRICEYYKRVEPSSPVPLILQRARRLVDQSFMEVLNDLAASALEQVRVITGEKEKIDT